MDYTRAIRKFLSGQYLTMGIILTVSVVLPAVVLYHYDVLLTSTALPLGALCCGLTDSPGPVMHRRNTLYASLGFNFVMVLVAGYSRMYPGLIVAEIAVFGMFFSLIGVYGSRINSLGLIALLVFIFNIDKHARGQNIIETALLFSAGGAIYVLLALLQSTLRPYKLIQQLMGECIIETSGYLQAKAEFYKPAPDMNALYDTLIHYQVKIHQQHGDLRELLFKTRQIVTESTRKGRVLMLMFLDLIDLFERIITSQQDYVHLHEAFDGTGILEKINKTITALAAELHEIGLAVQAGFPSKPQHDIDALMEHLSKDYAMLRKEKIGPETVEQFILLRQILYSIQDIAERIKRMHIYTTYDRKVSKQYKKDVDLDKFISHQELDPRIIIENLSFKSSHCRHAVRITLALLSGYTISMFLTIGHGYWILLTIITIMKPAYSITRHRNIHRLLGTLTGGAIGFLVIYAINDTAILFAIMVLAMVLAYSFLRINYVIGVAGITVYVLVSLSFLSPGTIRVALVDRCIDTVIGSTIAYIVSAFVLPAWEHEQINEYIKESLAANSNYFKAVAANFLGKKTGVEAFKLARKDAFVKLANLSDNFQRMVSEPKTKQPKLELYHQFVVTAHMVTSYIASLSYYAQRTKQEYASKEFEPLIEDIEEHFMNASAVTQQQKNIPVDNPANALAINERVQNLLKQRKKELIAGTSENIMSVRKTLSDLKTITDQFHMISDITLEQVKILLKVYE